MGFRLEHRIGIAAPASAVWETLADLPRWGEWNPLNPRADGALRIGAPLELALNVPGEAPTTQKVQVVDWVPYEQLVWAARYGGGLVRSTRYIEIEALSETGCIVSNGELFDGLGARWISRSLRSRTRQGFAALGEALKSRVEGLRAAEAA